MQATNRAQNELLGMDCQLTRVKPDPFFATTSGTYSYAASSTLYVSTTGAQGSLVGDIRAVRELYIDTTNMSSLDELALDTNFTRVTEVETRPTENRVKVRFDATDSLGAGLADCTIKWPAMYNPGTTTIAWRAVAYTWPTQITSEAIALSVPEDFQHSLLFLHVLKHIERREFGRNDDAEIMYQRALSRFRLKYSKMPAFDGDLTCRPRLV
jgi:hypothetical protein